MFRLTHPEDRFDDIADPSSAPFWPRWGADDYPRDPSLTRCPTPPPMLRTQIRGSSSAPTHSSRRQRPLGDRRRMGSSKNQARAISSP